MHGPTSSSLREASGERSMALYHHWFARLPMPLQPLALPPLSTTEPPWKVLNSNLQKSNPFSPSWPALCGPNPGALVPSNSSFAMFPLPYRMALLHNQRPSFPSVTHPAVGPTEESSSTHTGPLFLENLDDGDRANIFSVASPTEKVDNADLRELEQFAASFKSRRIKLGFTQTNVGKYILFIPKFSRYRLQDIYCFRRTNYVLVRMSYYTINRCLHIELVKLPRKAVGPVY